MALTEVAEPQILRRILVPWGRPLTLSTVMRSPSRGVCRCRLALLKQLEFRLVFKGFLLGILLIKVLSLVSSWVEPLDVIIPLMEEINHSSLRLLLIDPPAGRLLCCRGSRMNVRYWEHTRSLRWNELLNVSLPVVRTPRCVVRGVNVSWRASETVASTSSGLWPSVVI